MDEKQFKPFHETYKIITFAMSVGNIYPNPARRKARLRLAVSMLLSVTPLSIIILINIYKCLMDKDLNNIFRHTTVVGPFLGGFFKMFLMNYKNVESTLLIDEINRDYALYNSLPPHHRALVERGVRSGGLYAERCWATFVACVVMTFPSMAVALNVYNYVSKAEPAMYMVHDVAIPFVEPDARFRTPCFELMFVYMTYYAMLYVVNFTGYDGFFGLCINHACLKMKLYCKAMEDAVRAETTQEMYQRIGQVIDDQCRLFRYVELIQSVFNMWLGIILVATIIQICTCVYQVTEGYEFDLRYFVFTIATVVHIYVPCRYSSKLKSMSAETATLLYCCDWERVRETRVRKVLLFMVMRAQQPMQIIAFNLFVFDMELFVSIMQTSYSMYTLLRS